MRIVLKNVYKYFFILIFENISLEALNLLFLLTQTHSFIKLRKAENLKNNIDFEASLQVNSGTCVSNLNHINFLLIYFNNVEEIPNIVNIITYYDVISYTISWTIILLTIWIWRKKDKFFPRLQIKSKPSNSLASEEKIWETPSDAPMYAGTEEQKKIYRNIRKSGCQQLPNCKFRKEYMEAEMPEYEFGSCKSCVLPRGAQDISDSLLDFYSNSKFVKRIRELQKKAEYLKNKQIPSKDISKRQYYRDVRTTNRDLDQAIKDFIEKQRISLRLEDTSCIPDSKYYYDKKMAKWWAERIKVYPDPSTIKFKNKLRYEIHRMQDSYILQEKGWKKILENIKKKICEKSKSSSYSLTEKKIDLNEQKYWEKEIDELDKYLKSIGFKK